MTVHYIAVLEDTGPETAIGVWFPDLRGCFSAGDTLEEAIVNAPEAATLWLEALEGKPWPKARSLTELRADPEFVEDLRDFTGDVIFHTVRVETPLKLAAE
jgi:predicted RNase H-like HicB family nuclease